jgi:Fe-S cluster assembly scaffold protein SufB
MNKTIEKFSLKEFFKKHKNISKDFNLIFFNGKILKSKNISEENIFLSENKNNKNIFLRIEKNEKIKKPLEILLIGNCQISIVLEENSSLFLTLKSVTLKSKKSLKIDFHLKKGAKLKKICFFEDFINMKSLSEVEDKAKLDFVFFSKNSKIDYEVNLKNKSNFSFNGIFLLKKKEKAFFKLTTNHRDKKSFSHQMLKTIVKDEARVNFEATVRIEKECQKSVCSLLNKNLLLGENASVLSKPYLEILSDDVKASHGSNIFRLEEEQLFYLNTKAISKEKIKTLLIKGFLKEIIDLIEIESIRKKIKKYLENY